jgi:hypothetical protein
MGWDKRRGKWKGEGREMVWKITITRTLNGHDKYEYNKPTLIIFWPYDLSQVYSFLRPHPYHISPSVASMSTTQFMSIFSFLPYPHSHFLLRSDMLSCLISSAIGHG